MSVGPNVLRKMLAAQNDDRDRAALLLLYWCGLRRNELRLIQFRNLDLAARELTVVGGKNGAWTQALPEHVARQLERYVLSRMPDPDEYLLYPHRLGRRGSYPDYTAVVTWEDRRRPLTSTGVDQWWRRRVDRAGLERFRMGDFRYAVRRAKAEAATAPCSSSLGRRSSRITVWISTARRRLAILRRLPTRTPR